MASIGGARDAESDPGAVEYAEAELRIQRALRDGDAMLDLRDLRHLTMLPQLLEELSGLKDLKFSAQSMPKFPALVGKLVALEALTVCDARLADFPEQIGRLRNLRDLTWLEDDPGSPVLPDWIGSLRRLRRVLLSMPRITELPASLGNLIELRWLALRTPQLRMLPTELGGLPHLCDIRLYDAAFANEHREVARQGSAAILAFLRAQAADALVPQWWSRVLIVGEAAVGKTCLAKHLLGRQFDPDEGQTHGVHIETLGIAHPEQASTTMNLNIWDFGGQLEYRATQRLYLTDRSLFLLVWNARTRWQDGKVIAWLDAITARAPHSPVIVVATHCDDPSPAVLPEDLRERYPQIVGTHYVDSKSHVGIPELMVKIQAEAMKLPLMGVRWPPAWIAAAGAVRQMPGRFVSAARVWRTMAAAGVTDEQDQQVIARALHDLGDLVYFADDRDLSQRIILQPGWLDEHITAVLDSRSVAELNGVLTRVERDRIWSDLEEPELADRLIRIMERFDLAYRIGDADSSSEVAFVVERLGDARPRRIDARWLQAAEQPGAREIGIAYRLKSRQAGIPTWFIAREHRFTTHLHWKYGALLHDRDPDFPAWAVVADDGREQPTVHLRVRGRHPVRFLSVLAEAFENILERRYPGLIEQRLVPCPCSEEATHRCPHWFPLTEVILEATDTDPRRDRKMRCPQSRIKVDACAMLDGLRGSIVEEKIDAICAQLAQQDSTLTRIEQQGLATLNGVRNLLVDRASAGVHCPSLFAVRELGRGGMLRRQSFELRLWCEWPYEPTGPHPLDDAGVYRLERMPDWLREYLPYLRHLVSVLGGVVPLIAPAVATAGVRLSERTKASLDTASYLIGDLRAAGGPGDAPPVLIHGAGRGPLRYAEVGADFRALRAALLTLDPTESWGGLSPVARPEDRRIVYLCRQHARWLEYPYLEQPAGAAD